MFSFKKKSILALFLLSASVLSQADYGPMTTCPGPYACALPSYLGIQFPDGSHQTVAAAASIGTIDSQTAATNGAVIASGALVMQSASSSRPGLVNVTTQTLAGAKTFSSVVAASVGVLLGGATAATNAVLVYKDGHAKSSQTTAPTAAPNANAGTGATCTVANATDSAGVLTLTSTAVSPSTGAQCAVSFNKAYNVAPVCVLTPASANSALLAVASAPYLTSATGTLTVNFAALDATGHAYVWNYSCVETQ